MLALLDGDCFVYASGFASDAVAKSVGETHQPLDFCLKCTRTMLDSVLMASKATDYVVFLSGPTSFRKEGYPAYKENRDPTHKPHWYQEIKEYLLEKHDAVYSEVGDEADDALGIAQCSGAYGPTIICTLDKDLDMIPGAHYNFSKNKKADGVYHVDPVEADRTFFRQLLKGDSSDNIPGLYQKMGKKATQAIMRPLDSLDNPADMYTYVVGMYDGDADHVDAMGQLLWIKRDNHLWTPPI